MKRVKSFVFNTFVTSGPMDARELSKLMDANRYTEETGIGFTNIQLHDHQLQATCVKRSASYIQDFDFLKNEMARKQIFVYSSVDFQIDLKLGIITVQGSQSQMNVVKTVLRNVRNLQYSSDPIVLSGGEFSRLMVENKISYRIVQMTIKQFNYDNGMTGRFSGDVTKQKTALELLEVYSTGIIKTTFYLELTEGSLTLQVLPSGNFKFLSNEDDADYYLDFLKQLIFS